MTTIKFFRPTIFLALLAYLGACNSVFGSPEHFEFVPSTESDLTFVVIGDTPYSQEDELLLEKAIPTIKMGGYPFVIHIGDYKGGRAECTSDHDERHKRLFEELKPIPMIYTPGDNEWTDCDRHKMPGSEQPYSDLHRLALIREMFFAKPPEVPDSFELEQQITETERENMTWVSDDIRLLTLHVTGTNNGRDWVTGDPFAMALEAVNRRDKVNLRWLRDSFAKAKRDNAKAVIIAMQGDPNDIENKPKDVMCETVANSDKHGCDAFTDLRAGIRDEALSFGKPVLVIHGDTAYFNMKQYFNGEGAPNLWILNAAGDAGPGYGVRDVTEVSIDLSADMPFTARGLITGQRPSRKQ